MSAVSTRAAIAGLLIAAATQAHGATAPAIPQAVIPKSFFSAPCGTSTAVPTGGKTYYVSPTGSDSNSGLSAAHPFKTVGHAFVDRILKPRDVVLVAPGTYNESIQILTPGAKGACITLMGMPGQARPVITWANNAYATINVWAPYIRISGLAVTHPEPTLDPTARYNAGNSGIDAYSQVKADSNGVLRPTVHHVQFDNNVAFGSGCGGISFESVDYVLAYGNTVYSNAYAGGGHCSGISIYEAVNLDSKPGYHLIIADNFSFGNGNLYTIPGVTYITDENGLIFDDSRNSQAKARSPNLPYIPYTGATLFFGNVIYGNGGRGIEVYTSDYVDVFNNVTYENLQDKELRNYPDCGGEILSGYSGHMRFENNIVVSYSPELEVLSQVGVTEDLDSNLWTHNISDVGLIALGKQNSGNAGAAIGYGVNPMFVKPSATASNPIRDFDLRAASPAHRAGEPVDIKVTDIYGHSIAAGGAISIGAYVK